MDAFVPEVAPPPLLECRDLTKRYGATVALDRFTVSLAAGRIVGLLGPNGSGKTTLLKMTPAWPIRRRATFARRAMRWARNRRRSSPTCPSDPTSPVPCACAEMIAFFADFYEDFDAALARDMLARLGVPEGAPCAALSKGTVEKVQLTLVMARHAALYLLDEPIGGVDPAARDYILQTVIRAYRPQSSIILSTHLVRDVEAFLDDFILLRYGQMLLHAPVAYVTQGKGTTLDAFFREEFRC